MTLIPTTSIPIETQRGDKSDYNIDGFATIRDVPVGIPWNIFTSFQRYLLDGNIIPEFDESRNILLGFYLDYTCIEYSDTNIRERDKANNQIRYELVNLFQSKAQDGKGRQIAKNVGEFEYNGKYYLVVSPRNTPLPQNDTIPERGVFMSIIVDMEKYNSSRTGEELLVTNTQAAVEQIIDPKK